MKNSLACKTNELMTSFNTILFSNFKCNNIPVTVIIIIFKNNGMFAIYLKSFSCQHEPVMCVNFLNYIVFMHSLTVYIYFSLSAVSWHIRSGVFIKGCACMSNPVRVERDNYLS